MNIYADVIRVEDTSSTVSGVLRTKQMGFANDGLRQIIYKDAASGYWNFTPDENRVAATGSGITGSGTQWYVPVWTASDTLTNGSGIYLSDYDLVISGTLVANHPHASIDTDAFLVVDGGSGIKYRTGAELLSDLSVPSLGSGTTDYIPLWTSSGTLIDSQLTNSGDYTYSNNSGFIALSSTGDALIKAQSNLGTYINLSTLGGPNVGASTNIIFNQGFRFNGAFAVCVPGFMSHYGISGNALINATTSSMEIGSSIIETTIGISGTVSTYDSQTLSFTNMSDQFHTITTDGSYGSKINGTFGTPIGLASSGGLNLFIWDQNQNSWNYNAPGQWGYGSGYIYPFCAVPSGDPIASSLFKIFDNGNMFMASGTYIQLGQDATPGTIAASGSIPIKDAAGNIIYLLYSSIAAI